MNTEEKFWNAIRSRALSGDGGYPASKKLVQKKGEQVLFAIMDTQNEWAPWNNIKPQFPDWIRG